MDSNNAKERRRIRKAILSNRRTGSMQTTSNTQGSSIIGKLSSGQHTLRRKTTNVCDIATIDLTVDDEITDEQQPTDIIVGISQDYFDHGDQTVICELCHAKFFPKKKLCHAKLWNDEALRGKRGGMKTSYSLCCLYGKVELPKQKEMPTTYTSLFRCVDSKSKYFMKNIREKKLNKKLRYYSYLFS
ncbi:hypothetical protein OSB04_028285 [Centaurea solstitialis]|uniref:Uncharacterized protein n=1 Tax=Centaurea solstitialis TaxID=347529 RepID=A0AA38SGY3_9ASTR|nr:hypothetical protein OSB04_028285 [Centaurea solstitialis]